MQVALVFICVEQKLSDMDNIYQHRAPPEKQKPPVYPGGFPSSSAAPEAIRWALPPDHAAPPAPAYGFNFYAPSHGAGGFGGSHLAPPYGFDPSVHPPPFACPPPEPFPNTAPSAPLDTYHSLLEIAARPAPPNYDFQSWSDSVDNRQRDFEDLSEAGALFGGPLLPPPCQNQDRRLGTTTAEPEDEAVVQRRQDAQWLRRFLQSRGTVAKGPQCLHPCCIRTVRELLYGAAQLVSALEDSCQTLKRSVENDCVWTDSYVVAQSVRRALQDRVTLLRDGECLNKVKAKLSRIGRRRARRLRASIALQQEEKHRQKQLSDKEAAIDTWRMKQIHAVEERKKEQELKLAADSVLCEVRKKQADVKRMQDILRSLEKLRRLRKEAASRKGIITEQECDEAFIGQLEQLRSVMKRRTAVYSVEEKALMVMLEGEQEEERRREQDRRVKKERERQLQKKHRVEAMLFGDELPVDSMLQPFREYYVQDQRSLLTLIHLRRDWDVFVTAADHPSGSPVPQGWILPDPPSDQDWASALHTADTD